MARLAHWNAAGNAERAWIRATTFLPIPRASMCGMLAPSIFWSRTLEVSPERIQEAVRKAGTLVEEVKRELGIAGV